MALIFLFVDGLGLGEKSENNPLYINDYTSLQKLTGGQKLLQESDSIYTDDLLFKHINARLGVEGLPQSGTGQVTMFSGENASKLIGKHFGPYPHSKTHHLIKEKSLFLRMIQEGLRPYFMNAFPEVFFDHAKKRNRWSVTTLMTKSAGLHINMEKDVRSGDALTAEIFQDVWRERLNIDMPTISGDEAADRVLKKCSTHDLILIEYYMTDKAGHEKSQKRADWALSRLDNFMNYLLQKKQQEHTLLLTSDHGNVEDLSTKSHTFNDVPLAVYGPGTKYFEKVESLKDLNSAIMSFFSSPTKL